MQPNFHSVLLWGFAATLVLTTTMSASQGLRLTRMSIPVMLGTMLSANLDRAPIYGFGLHLLNGWVFSTLYALAFEAWNQATWWMGAVLGLLHGLFVLVALMPVLPSIHPRMASEHRQPEPTALLEPPGILALNYGVRTPVSTLVAHVLYGLVLGLFYRLAP